MRSKSKNTPFDGWQLRGGVAATIVGGRTIVYAERKTRCETARNAPPLRTKGTSNLFERNISSASSVSSVVESLIP